MLFLAKWKSSFHRISTVRGNIKAPNHYSVIVSRNTYIQFEFILSK